MNRFIWKINSIDWYASSITQGEYSFALSVTSWGQFLGARGDFSYFLRGAKVTKTVRTEVKLVLNDHLIGRCSAFGDRCYIIMNKCGCLSFNASVFWTTLKSYPQNGRLLGSTKQRSTVRQLADNTDKHRKKQVRLKADIFGPRSASWRIHRFPQISTDPPAVGQVVRTFA
jgi:hypothetical protein